MSELPALLSTIFLASNHWRTLATIKKLLLDGSISKNLTYTDMIHLVATSISSMNPITTVDDEPLIIDAICANARRLDAVLLCGRTFEAAIGRGDYINTLSNDSM